MWYRLILPLWLFISSIALADSHLEPNDTDGKLTDRNQVSAERKQVKVGAYAFPPYFEFISSPKDTDVYAGATLDLIDALNAIQDVYLFKLFVTSPKRRYRDFENDRFDIILFENLEWGWEGYSIESSEAFMGGGEVYAALKKPERNQGFFDNVAARNLVGILGYHYGFANFNSDEEYLSRNFKIFLSSDHERNLQLILVDRPNLAEVVVVTKSYLNLFLRKHPNAEGKFLVSDKFDQRYRHSVLYRIESEFSAVQINGWLQELESNGTLEAIAKKYGLEILPAN